jgi:AcrR family transcriptional regulator
MTRSPRLSDRLLQATRDCILAAAADEVALLGLARLTYAGVAARAGRSERTVYRHFATREALVAALAPEVSRRLRTPPLPTELADLPGFVADLFAAFEAQPALTREALESELFVHIRDGAASERGRALRELLDRCWPHLPEARRELAATNLRFMLTASAWHYHRTHLKLDAQATVEAVGHAVQCIVHALGPPTPRGSCADSAR